MTSIIDTASLEYLEGFRDGFRDGFKSALESDEVNELVEALKEIADHWVDYELKEMTSEGRLAYEALAKFKKAVKR